MMRRYNDRPDPSGDAVPEHVVEWLEAGGPQPVPPAVEAWLAADPTREALIGDFAAVWEASEPPPPPPDLWQRVRRRIREADSASRRAHPWLRYAAAVAMLATGMGAGRLWPHLQDAFQAGPGPTVIEVPAGATSNVELPGEILVRLNAASRLEFEAKQGRVTDVRLDGEAYFAVPHDPSRELRVITAAGVVRDIGTEFNVHARDTTVTVTVIEGEVELAAAGAAVRIAAGQTSSARSGSPPAPATAADVFAARAWLEGLSVFRNERLEVIATELERRYATPFEVAPELRDTRLTATIRARTAEEAARAICSGVGATCRAVDGGWRIGTR